ncbi:hypothetical protein TNCV_1940691 [Trichonephila clavipes]|nr:hypothetical protein TNCV_1940691 [Trichonephila clavipes]
MIAGRETNFKRALDSTVSCLPPSGGRKGKMKREHRTNESKEVTLPDSDRGEHCFGKDFKSATLGAELRIIS